MLHFVTPENVRKTFIFWRFQGVQKWDTGLQKVKKLLPFRSNVPLGIYSFQYSTATAEHGEELQQRLAQYRLIRRLRG